MGLEFTPGKTRIGWIGTGVMGSSMCGHLIAAGYPATVFNRTADKAKPLVEQGGQARRLAPGGRRRRPTSSSRSSAFPSDVREVTLGPDGTLAGAKPGTVLVDMTTSEPALAIEIDQAARAKGVHAVDAPVSGGDVGAREARLSIMIGGEKEVVDALAAALRDDGQDDRPPGARRRGPAHQDGQPGPDRLQHDRRLRRRCSTPSRPGST